MPIQTTKDSLVYTRALVAGMTGALIGAVSEGGARLIGHAMGFVRTDYFQRAIAHGIFRGILAKIQGGNFSNGFMSTFASTLFGKITDGLRYASDAIKATVHALVGGTVSAISGGKFANGAVSSLVTWMFNDLHTVSASVSGGLVGGGTREYGLAIAHNDNEPWYKGWSFGVYKASGAGAYLGAGISAETSYGSSDNDTLDALKDGSRTTGVSYEYGISEVGTETSVPDDSSYSPHTNVSIGLGIGTPYEGHAYVTHTDIIWSWKPY